MLSTNGQQKNLDIKNIFIQVFTKCYELMFNVHHQVTSGYLKGIQLNSDHYNLVELLYKVTVKMDHTRYCTSLV